MTNTDRFYRMGGNKRKVAEDACKAVEAFREAKQEIEKVESLAQVLKYLFIHEKHNN